MSLFKKLGRAIRPLAGAALGVVGGAFGGPAGAAIGSRIGGVIAQRGRGRSVPFPAVQGIAALPVLAGAARILPGLGRIGSTIGRVARTPAARRVGRVAGAIGTVVSGGLILDALTGEVVGRRRSKRINPMNVKAMRRAIRRVKGGRKIAQEIERMLPKRRSTAATACPPQFARRTRRKC